ncbi:MAG TPA: hypothetical protein ENK31_05900 [Nannocystis exedens]|nr:hypothetical protein [Nannocystis exedens]
MIESRLGPTAESELVAAVAAGKIIAINLTPALYQRCMQLIDSCADLSLGLGEACLVSVAERYDRSHIATLNHREFTVVSPSHTEALVPLPGPL